MQLSKPIERLAKYAQGVLGLSSSDVLLCSFPKSGNTWVRIMMLQLLRRKHGLQGPFTFDELDQCMPEIGVNNLMEPWTFAAHSRRLVKTHLNHNVMLRRCPAILLTRNPKDVMVSYYHYATATKAIDFQGEFDEFVRHPRMGLDAYFRHHDSWSSYATLQVGYAEIKQGPVRFLRQLAQICRIQCTVEDLKQAVEDASFEAVREAQRVSSHEFRGKFKSGFKFARGSTSDEWDRLASNETSDFFQSRIEARRDIGRTLPL